MKTTLHNLSADGIMTGATAKPCNGVFRPGRSSGMTDGRGEQRESIALEEGGEYVRDSISPAAGRAV